MHHLERLVKFEVLGQEYPLHTDAPEDEVQEILDLVKTQIESATKQSKLMPAKVAVLVSLNMAGKYVRLKREYEEYKQIQEDRISSLVDQIVSKS